MDVDMAPDVEKMVSEIVDTLSYGPTEWQAAMGKAKHQMGHINEFRIICMRSRNATASAYARIWNLPDIWQKALGVSAFYIIEVLSQHYDPLSQEK
jgi:predicted metallopeptidase